VQALHYDNRGNRTGVRSLQWAWDTHHPVDRLGSGHANPGPRPGPDGRTWIGFARPETWVDVRFRTAYLMGRARSDRARSARAGRFPARGGETARDRAAKRRAAALRRRPPDIAPDAAV